MRNVSNTVIKYNFQHPTPSELTWSHFIVRGQAQIKTPVGPWQKIFGFLGSLLQERLRRLTINSALNLFGNGADFVEG